MFTFPTISYNDIYDIKGRNEHEMINVSDKTILPYTCGPVLVLELVSANNFSLVRKVSKKLVLVHFNTMPESFRKLIY